MPGEFTSPEQIGVTGSQTAVRGLGAEQNAAKAAIEKLKG